MGLFSMICISPSLSRDVRHVHFRTHFSLPLSLPLEHSRVIPEAALAVGKAYNAAMRLACQLQSLGSNLVIEEDLALLSEHYRIVSNIASSLRTLVAKIDVSSPVVAGISLPVDWG